MQAVKHISREGQAEVEKAQSKQLLEQLLQQHVLNPISKPQPGPKEVASGLSALSLLSSPIAELLGDKVRPSHMQECGSILTPMA